MTTHELKTSPAFFEAMWTGDQTFDIRYADRSFQKGDTVVLREHDPARICTTCPMRDSGGRDHRQDDCGRYTGREVEAEIGCVIASTPNRGSQRGFWGNGYVVFSLCRPQRVEVVDEADVAAAPRPVTIHVTEQQAPTPADLAERVRSIR